MLREGGENVGVNGTAFLLCVCEGIMLENYTPHLLFHRLCLFPSISKTGTFS